MGQVIKSWSERVERGWGAKEEDASDHKKRRDKRSRRRQEDQRKGFDDSTKSSGPLLLVTRLASFCTSNGDLAIIKNKTTSHDRDIISV